LTEFYQALDNKNSSRQFPRLIDHRTTSTSPEITPNHTGYVQNDIARQNFVRLLHSTCVNVFLSDITFLWFLQLQMFHSPLTWQCV